MRRLLVVLGLGLLSGCAGFKAVDRGDWFRVYADPAQRGPEATQAVISRDAYEEEVAGGTRRTWEPPPGYAAPFLHETPAIGVKVGMVAEFRVEEEQGATLLLDGGGVRLFWTESKKRDEWKAGADVTRVESTVFVLGTTPGKATLRLVSGNTTKDVPVTVSP